LFEDNCQTVRLEDCPTKKSTNVVVDKTNKSTVCSGLGGIQLSWSGHRIKQMQQRELARGNALVGLKIRESRL
jgi:hypothetical protein